MMDKRVREFLNKDVLIKDDAMKQLEAVLRLSDIFELVVLPDIHSKEDSFPPKGIVALTRNTLYPFLLSNEVGCGIRVFKTDLSISDLDENVMDGFFSILKKNLKNKALAQSICGKKDYLKIFTNDITGLKEKFLIGKALVNLERHTSFLPGSNSLQQILKLIPKKAFKKSYERLGAVGSGNHFLELQAIDKIFDEQSAQKLGLKKGQVVFMFHTGGKLPLQLTSFYEMDIKPQKKLKAIEKKLRKFLYHFSDFNFMRLPLRTRLFLKNSLNGIPSDTPEAKKFLKLLSVSYNFCFLNRSVITEIISLSLKKAFNREPAIALLSDTMHESLDFEQYPDGKFWVHRNGGTKGHTGDLIPLPGFMGGPSFICITDEGVKDTRYSLGHGVGRNFDKDQARERFKIEDIHSHLKNQNIRLYRLGEQDLREQSPFAFKDIHKVISVLKAHRLSRPVALTQPLGILKG
jgi:tRNA-splicing ligase RtcB